MASRSPRTLARPGAAPATAAPGRVRIIGGQWKRTPLPVPDVPGLRPTPDRVRGTLFNWLGQSLAGWRCLDLFAGSGALGLEAASRGAAKVLLVERDRRACRMIAETITRLSAWPQVELIEGDARVVLGELATRREPGFDLVFLDPPFSEDRVEPLWSAIEALVADGGLIYVESHQRLEARSERWRLERAGRAGQVHYHLLRRIGAGSRPDRSD